MTVFPLRTLIDESLEMLRGRMEARGIRASVQLPDPEVRVRADREKILQVLVNVVGNAVKYNREGGAVEVAVGPAEPGYLAVHVRDTGVGIPPGELERVFERFFRSESGQSREGRASGCRSRAGSSSCTAARSARPASRGAGRPSPSRCRSPSRRARTVAGRTSPRAPPALRPLGSPDW